VAVARSEAAAEPLPAAARPTPAVVVATLLQERGPTGVQSHFNAVLRFLEAQQSPAECVTPFSSPAALVYPVLGVRRLLEPVSSSLAVWWYRRWHGRLLEHALARRLAREAGPVVVYAQCPVSAAAALRARRTGDVRVVLAVHFNVSQADEWADKGQLERSGSLYRRIREFEESILPQVDGIVYVSEFMRGELQERIPALTGVRSSVVPNFVDLPAAEPGATRRRDLVSVGSLEPRKNQQYLFEILQAAAEQGHRYTLTLLGDGPDRPRLEQAAHRLGVADQVEFLGFRRDSQRLVAEHRVLCHTARVDNFPLTILEAMAQGVPVAAAPVGGIPEMLRDGVEGVFWPLDAPEAAARILISRLEDATGLAAMGSAARRRVAESFSTEVVAHRLVAFLHAA
jgi:glycosyltransferase involved in cell wall biosynthesis